jgi:DNA polymerase III subunit gamma/tau
MSDLIVYLRDLLVFKAKPDVLDEDIDPDLKKSLAAHAELIATDRLLELIDQLAAAEGRMKWAPNKKLHFEVAIIRAIQSLGQATLDEVIEKLGELRDGKSTMAEKSSVAAGVSPAPGKAGRAASIASAGRTDPGENKSESARVTESPPKYKAAEPSAEIDPLRVWEQLSAQIPPQKAFVRNSAAAAHVLGIDGRNFQIGFAPDDKAMMDILGTQANRKFLETLLHEITGKDWSLRLSVNQELPSKHASVLEGGSGSRSDEFKDDPLIQEALEMFNAQIKP